MIPRSHEDVSSIYKKKCKYRTLEKYSNTYYKNKQNINPACGLNICLSSLLSSVKRRHILCTGEHGKWNIKCIVFYSHECLCEILHLISTVVCQMLTLYCGKGGGGPEIFPVCPDDDSMC
jgi:hypothetical protein